MVMAAKAKAAIVKEYQRSAKDTGSSEVQIALLTARVTKLTEHLKQFPKDKHSRTGLLKLVSQRRKLLDYLRKDKERYLLVIEKLNLRK